MPRAIALLLAALGLAGVFASLALATAPNQPQLDNNTVQENKPAGTVVGTLSSSDPDGGTTFTYQLVAGTGDTDNGKFKIVGDKLSTRVVLDYETQQTASVRVRVTDAQGETNRSVFTIQITNDTSDDVAHGPTNINLSNHDVAENQPAETVVGTLTATDPDAGDTFTYKMSAGGTGAADNTKFHVTGDQLKTKQPLDFETQSTLAIRIQVTDSQGNQFAKRFTITVTDNNDTPSDITFSNLSVPENSASGTTVGTASTTDQDAADTFTYSLVAGTGDDDNASFTMDGATLKTAASFDFETKNQYSVRVQTDDGHGGTFQKAFVVQVTDVTENSAPTNISLSPSSVAENQASGTEVGTLTSTDPDAGDTFTYSLVTGTGDTDNASFTIAGDKLKTAAVFDFETKSSYSIRVQTDDGHSHTFSKQLTVTVTDVEENVAPTDITFNNLSVAENSPTNTTVGTASSTDANAGDTHTYTLVTGTGDDDNASFTFSGADLKTSAVFDFETKSSYSIRVQTDDGHGGTFEKAFTVTVTNVNEAPTNIALSKSDVDENQPSGTTVGTLSATDVDAGDTHTFSLVTGTGDTDNASFTISGSSLKTNAVFNYEAKNSYSIRVRATDSGNLTFDKVFTITINNVNEAPTGVTDTYSGAVGNTQFALGTSPSGPHITGSGSNPKANDTDPEGDTISCVAEDVTSAGGGSAHVNSDCTYTFTPGVGDKSQTDSFTYHPTDGTLNGSGTIQVAIGSSLVWYLDRDAASNGDGRSSSPLQNLAGINGAGGSGDSDTTNEIIFLYGSATAYTGGLPLESGQQLIGEPQGLVVNATTLVSAGGSNPNMQNSGGTAITLGEGNTLRRVSINSASGDGIAGTNINNADIGGSTAISGVTGADFKLSGGNGTVTVGSAITNTAGRAVDIQNRTGGTTTISGTINDSNGTGIILNQNSGGHATAFTNTLTLSTGANPAFTATGSGTVTATGTGNTLTTTTGRALNVTNLIGAADLTFQSISANGAANGIFLSATGSAGGLHVTGNGTAGSGGTIQNTTGADNTTDGIGVYLNDTDDVQLNRMSIHDHSNYAIKGASVIGFTLADSTVNGANGTLTNIDSAVDFDNLTGTATFPRDTISGGFFNNLDITNTSGALNLTVGGDNAADATTIGLNQTNANDGIFLRPDGASTTITAKVKNDTFTGAGGDMFSSSPINGGTMNLTLANNTMNNAHSNIAPAGGGVTLGASGGTNNVTVTGNTISGPKGTAILAFADLANGVLNGTFSGNNIGNNTAFSGSSTGGGISIDANQGGDLKVKVATNTIKHMQQNGITVTSGDCGPTTPGGACTPPLMEVTIDGNTISNGEASGTSNYNGIFFQSAKLSSDSAFTACADIKNNSLAGTGRGPNAGLNSDLRVRDRFSSTVKLPGYTGANNDNTAVQNYLIARPNTVTTIQATNEVPTSGGFINGGTACVQPTF